MFDKDSIIREMKAEFSCYLTLKKREQQYLDELTVLLHKYNAIKSPSYATVRIENAYSAISEVTILDEQIEKAKMKLQVVQYRLTQIEAVLNLMSEEDREDIIAVYVEYTNTLDGCADIRNVTRKVERTNLDRAIIDAYLLYCKD